ncbi:MAG TPA: hypothetical protein VIY48_01785 [Candidatus Paceibacterota bacterium]
MKSTIPSMKESVEPLWAIAFMLGSENEYSRANGAEVLLDIAAQMAAYLYTMNHIKTCQKCASRARWQQFVSNVVKEFSE